MNQFGQNKNTLEKTIVNTDNKAMNDLPPDALVRIGKKGEGVYGIVYSALEIQTGGTRLAVKRNLIDKTGDFCGSIREMDLLARLNGHPHIVSLNSVSFGDPFGGVRGNALSPVQDSEYKDDNVHFIFEEAHEDGVSYFSKANWRDLKKSAVELLIAIEYCHAKGIIHRDLKPANLLIFYPGPVLKICDFGLSKPITNQGKQTPSIVTSWYRAPEILLDQNYDQKIDLWSVGCILYEMITKLPLLHGSPDRPNDILDYLTSVFPNLVPKRSRSLSRKTRTTWQSQIKKKAQEFSNQLIEQDWDIDLFIDLLEHLLVSAQDRYTAHQALEHPFFAHQKDYIISIQDKFPPIRDNEVSIKIDRCQERSVMCNFAKSIFKNKHKYSWYSDRILFQAISLYDRYMTRRTQANTKIRAAFLSCLYLAIKYFTTLTPLIPFTVIYGEISYDDKKWVEHFEYNLIDKICGYVIYQPTLYESPDLFNEVITPKHVEDLFNITCSGLVGDKDINGLLPSQVYSYYKDL